MRHRVSGTKFNVDVDHRDSLLKNLLTSYILHGEMTTTEAKAKAVKRLFDRAVTRAKKNDIMARRLVGQMVTEERALFKLFDELLPAFGARTSGYSTSEHIVGERAGDSARMMRIKILVEKKESEKPVRKATAKKSTTEKKSTRKRVEKKVETEEETQ